MSVDTVFAVATGAGRAAVAVVRLSGPASGPALDALAGGRPRPREASLRHLGRVGETPLDHALVLWFPGPRSFTGEDCAELHLHGGRAVVAAVLEALSALPRCRLAEPGEFTRRAFQNGKMDLASVEGLADLIDAQTEAQRRQAVRQLGGALGAFVARQRERLLHALAAAESVIDFSDEADVAGNFFVEALDAVAAMHRDIDTEIGRAGAAERLRAGVVVVIAGPPNAGKSTLLNALARRDVAIVSPHAGTTRDAIAIELDLGGHLVEVIDTAGLRDSDDPVERDGMARARRRAREADLVLWLSDIRDPVPPDPALGSAPVLRIATKADLVEPRPFGTDLCVSAVTGEGWPALMDAVGQAVAARLEGASDGIVTRLRHQEALQRAAASLEGLLDQGAHLGIELVADELRNVALQLDVLVGRIDSEEILGAIFARFCIGK